MYQREPLLENFRTWEVYCNLLAPIQAAASHCHKSLVCLAN
uniref:Uncharacterized protein MANES_18G079400 n=1 Tax=Rhizophora mucronata TaxID=61149 RepID=A0A2P2K712_RHIMU